MVRDLFEAGILDSADEMLVATAAMHYGVAVEAHNKLDQPGLVHWSPMEPGTEIQDTRSWRRIRLPLSSGMPRLVSAMLQSTWHRSCRRCPACQSRGEGPSSRSDSAGSRLQANAAAQKAIPSPALYAWLVTLVG